MKQTYFTGNVAGVRVLIVALALAVAGPFGSTGLLGIGREMNRQQGIAGDKSEYDSEIELLTEAIQSDPNRAENYFNRGMTYTLITEYDQAIPDFDQAIQLDPQYGQAYYSRAYAYAAKGDYAKAIADYGQTTQLSPSNAEAYNNLAWLLATCPQAAYRDGKKAIGYASKACELTGWKEAASLDTLAAAYAEAGDFDNAVKWENMCLTAPNLDSSIATDAKTRLGMYQAHQAYHDE